MTTKSGRSPAPDYGLGSAFTDDTFEEDSTPSSPYANPFANGVPDADYMKGDTADSFGMYDFTGATPALDHDITSRSRNRNGRSGSMFDLPTVANIDPGTIAPALGVYSRSGASTTNGPGRLDYVFAEDYKLSRKKSGSEQLTYLAGSAYLCGAFTGGAVGIASAMRESAGKTGKLRLNAILNATSKRGALYANSLGVLALMFSLSETGLHNLTHDDSALNYAAAGALSGSIFKSTKGIRVAGIWGLGGAALALGAVYASRQGMYGRGIQGIL